MSKKDFSVALKYVEARPRSQRRKGAEARVSGISVVGSGASATDLSLLQANLISVTNNFTALKDLFDSMFEKDSDGNIHAKLSLWSSGGITAGGVGSGGASGGGASYDRLDSWADYSADKAGYVLSALLGKDLDNRVSALANAGYITASYLAPYALRSEIPSLAGYATQSWVESKNYLTGITSSMVTTALGYTPYNSANFTKDNLKSTLGISDWALASVKPTYTASEVGAMSVYGGTINSPSLASLVINRNNSTGASVITFTRNSDFTHFLGFNDNSGPKWLNAGYQEYPLLHSGNYSSYALPITGGTVNGSITANSFTGVINSVAPTALFRAMSYTAGQYSRSASEEDGKIFIGSSVNNKVISSPNYDGTNTAQNIQSLRLAYNSSFFTEIATTPNSNHLWKRNVEVGGANPWERFVTEKAGVTWNISITGNADSTNRLRFVQITSAYGDLNTLLCGGGLLYNFASPSYWVNAPADVLYGAAIQFQATKAKDSHSLSGQMLWDVINGSDVDCTRSLWWRAADSNGFVHSKWHQIAFTDSNVASATKLATPRTIWGQSFDGTGDITGALTSQALRSAGIYIGCDASGVASDNYTREINTYANKLYLQYRGGDLDLCGGGGTTYLGGALEGKTANFTSLTAPAVTTNTLKVGNVTLVEENGALKVIGGFIATGGVTSGEKAS